MTQAVANAQRTPHPFCEPLPREGSEVYIPGKSKPITVPDPYLCQMSNLIPDISLLNAGAVRNGEILAGEPITNETVANFLPFATSTIAYLRLIGEDLVKVLDNAMNHVTQEDPIDVRHFAAAPIASGLRFNLQFSAPPGEKVTNIEVLVRDAFGLKDEVWLPIEGSPKRLIGL